MNNEEQIARARALSGENYSGARQQLPTIKFMGRGSQYGEGGKFYLLIKNKEGNLDSALIGDTCSVVILKVRIKLDNGESDEARKFVYEFDSASAGTMVTMKVGKGEPFLIPYADVRKQHPDLKYIQVLYVYYAGQIAKLNVSGGSLSPTLKGNLFEYLQSIPPTDTVMRYITEIESKEIEHTKGNYFAMTFKRGKPNPDFEPMLNALEQLALPTPPAAQVPQLESGNGSSNGEGEISVESIPF